jgi:hypothetical protein
MEDDLLNAALRPGEDCPSLDELGRYADGALGREERSALEAHVHGCPSCEAELALLRALTSIEVAAQPTRPASRSRWLPFDSLRANAAAAVLLVGIVAAGSYWLSVRRAPVLPSQVSTTGGEVRRSLSIAIRGPIGDQRDVPQRFEWLAAPGALRYRVRLMTVDRQELWSTVTTAPAVELPASVQSALAPGRTLLWNVSAYGGDDALIAESGTQTFRVVPR